ncbi:hypothetical protein GCM10011402_37190 [Paracoccus acridae]|uniref:Uncharacterized protein n=1 Tax=Paracoccus acridae TaxID=1795310 RepID=A0ABQ1VMD6_9RHOB|nr:hypothetical protein [Paracoccus acridae]GGF81127.1 hypothetical protein GCM10011402_37190 [Paracoccus acridae]
MSLDPATQAISRFIGLLDLIVEESRLRQDYLKFKAKISPETDGDFLPGISARLIIGGQPGDYDPGLSYRPVSPSMKTVEADPYYYHSPVQLSPLAVLPVTPPASTDALLTQKMTGDLLPIFADGPGSIMAVTIQTAYLADDDLLLDGLGGDFIGTAQLHAALERIDMMAEAIEGFDLPPLPVGMDWMGAVQAVLDQFDAVPIGQENVPAAIHTYRGDDAEGQVVDGKKAEEAPDWSDLLPIYLRPAPEEEDAPSKDPVGKDDEAASPGGLSATDGETIIRTKTGADGDSKTSQPGEHDFSRDFAGHDEDDGLAGNQIIAGANTAINEIGVGVQWIDASVIVVQGDVAKVQAINQVNVLVEHDSINGSPVTQESTGFNIAEILTTSSKTGESGSDDLPSDWQLFRLEASLYQVNWVKQITYATDFDRAEVTFSAQMTFLDLGENEIVNSAILNEYGYRFDVMFVSGNMIDATIISQKNVLFDSDSMTTGSGDPAMAAGLSMSDNLLYNKAAIKTVGVDSFAQMSKSFADAADDLAAGRDTHMRDLTQDQLFAGQEILRALQIDGDLVKINLFEQENIVGDADQLRLDMQRMREEFGDQVKVIAGSNALVNLASITETGVDSTIMAGGKVYDDALIHQAEWFDTDAPDGGAQMAGLTKEAIAAFLTDDLARIDPASEGIMPTESYDHGSNLDVMQGVLA